MLAAGAALAAAAAVPAAAMADEQDMSSMTLDELVQLRSAADAEIQRRLADASTTLLKGTYVVGKDIEAGSYVYTASNDMTTVCTFSTEDGASKLASGSISHSQDVLDEATAAMVTYLQLNSGESTQVRLEDGWSMFANDDGTLMPDSEHPWTPGESDAADQA